MFGVVDCCFVEAALLQARAAFYVDGDGFGADEGGCEGGVAVEVCDGDVLVREG